MSAPSPVEQYRKQQEEADRLVMLKKSQHHPFINGLLKFIFGSEKS